MCILPHNHIYIKVLFNYSLTNKFKEKLLEKKSLGVNLHNTESDTYFLDTRKA